MTRFFLLLSSSVVPVTTVMEPYLVNGPRGGDRPPTPRRFEDGAVNESGSGSLPSCCNKSWTDNHSDPSRIAFCDVLIDDSGTVGNVLDGVVVDDRAVTTETNSNAATTTTARVILSGYCCCRRLVESNNCDLIANSSSSVVDKSRVLISSWVQKVTGGDLFLRWW